MRKCTPHKIAQDVKANINGMPHGQYLAEKLDDVELEPIDYNEADSDFTMADEDTDDKLLDELVAYLPEVVTALKEVNQLENWIEFHRLIKDKQFPLDNIAFHLFMDVCKFYSQGSSTSMRYDPRIQKFWRIGYCLFHGKFLNFMSGPKNYGQKIEHRDNFLNPEDARVNFVVPFKGTVSKSKDHVDIKPGVLTKLIDRLAEQSDEYKTYKLCVDGKKINSGRSDKNGDIDLFGFEKPPTLDERKRRLEEELLILKTTSDRLVTLEIQQKVSSDTFNEEDKLELISLLKQILLNVSVRIQQLRKTKVSKGLILEKLKKESGPDWRKSKYVFVISSLETDLYDVSGCIEDLLQSVDEVGYCIAAIQSVAHLYAPGKIVCLENQINYVHLNQSCSDDAIETDSRFVKQGSERWHEIRRSAKVTGSTLNNAVGLGTLKQQHCHFDRVFYNKSTDETSEDIKQRMKYGSENEIHAVTTLVSKVMPVYAPNLVYVEEGCYQHYIGTNKVLMVVSPDGSIRDNAVGTATYGVECKCPYPGKTFTTPVYYSIPKYYITQVLAEMVALGTTKLFLICYSFDSSTVFTVEFCEDLWESIENEVNTVYGGEIPSRSARKSEGSKRIKAKIDKFLKDNVTFVAELPSVIGIPCNSGSQETLCVHTIQNNEIRNKCTTKHMQESVRKCDTRIQRAYNLHRTRATELLGFMISDLDRDYNPEIHHAVPVAYGLKGYSLPTETLRNMIEHVLQICFEKGLYVPVCCFDGQWHRMAVRDREETLLTLLQLQKDVYGKAKCMNKNEIVRKICDINVVRCHPGDIQQGKLNITRFGTRVFVDNGNIARTLVMTQKLVKLLKSSHKEQDDIPHDSDAADVILTSLPENVCDIDDEVVQEAIDVAATTTNNSETACTEDRLGELEADDVDSLFQQSDQAASDTIIDTADASTSPMSVTVTADAGEAIGSSGFLKALNTQENITLMFREFHAKNPNVVTDINTFRQKLSSGNVIDKSFTKSQIMALISPLLSTLKANGIKCNVSQPKYVFIKILSDIFGDGTTATRKPYRKKKDPASLMSLCKKAVQKLPKIVLNCVYAQYIYPNAEEQWRNDSPFGYQLTVHGIDSISPAEWYSKPEYNTLLGNYILVILDAYHQICGLRRLFCASGIKKAGISKQPILQVAENSENNGSGLSVAIVRDMIDKQSVAYAVQTFSDQVENALRDMGAVKEATFCKLVRNWYLADDEPGLSALDRSCARLNFRQWLLDDVRFDVFPPYGSYVKDIPIVLFEGLVIGIERKLQLYSFTKTGNYNTRAVGSLDIENFFSSFQDIDPRGTGVLRPDDISTAIGVAMELHDARLQPDRGFYMQTCRKRVYPSNVLESNARDVEILQQFAYPVRDLSVIHIRDHSFDTEKRR